MPRKKKAPELTFQEHIADFLVREHRYGVLEQSDITDTEHFIAEDQLWAFLTTTQADTLTKLTDDYGTDSRDEVFKALFRLELDTGVVISALFYAANEWNDPVARVSPFHCEVERDAIML